MPQSARGRRQQRCGYHTCGKLGHATSRCWLAHPELRSQPHESSRQDRQSPQRSEESRMASQQFVPFKLLDLPSEVRNLIYEAVYGGAYDITATMPISPQRTENGRFRLITTQPRLHLVSRDIYQDTSLARGKSVFNGHLRCQYGPIPPLNSEIKYGLLRSLVNKITFFGCDSRIMNGVSFPHHYWLGIEGAFPNLQEIHLEWTQTKHRYARHSRMGYSDGWTNLQREEILQFFFQGRFDPEFTRPVERLKVPFLVRTMRRTSNINVFVTSTLQWLANGDERPFLQVRYSPINDGDLTNGFTENQVSLH